MPASLRVLPTRICPSDGSVMTVESLDEPCHLCEGCEVVRKLRQSAGRIRAAMKKEAVRRAKALKLAERTQKRKG
jgi:hypothetical protein